MELNEAQDAKGEGRKVKITEGEDKGHRGTLVRIFTSNGVHWAQVNSRTKTRYATIEDLELV